jgi:hypothetical protein
LLSFLSGLLSNCNPPDLHFLSNWDYWDYRCDPSRFAVRNSLQSTTD